MAICVVRFNGTRGHAQECELKESPYIEISKLVAEGATLDEVEAYIEGRTRGMSEDELSAAWLRDWHAREHPPRPPIPSLTPID